MNIYQWTWFLACASVFLVASGMLYHAAPSREAHYDRDSYGYNVIAEHFAQTSQLRNPYTQDMPVQTVGYPFFAGMLYKLFGNKLEVVILAQIILSLIAGLLTMNIALLLFGNTAAYVAAFLWSINLGFLIFSQFFMTEVLLITLLLASIYTFLQYMLFPHNTYLILSALFAGLSVAVKPVAILYILGFCFCIGIWAQGTIQKKLKTIVLFCCIFSIPVLSYMTFNKFTHNSFAVSSLINENIYVYFLSKINVHVENVGYNSAMQQILASLDGYPRTNPKRWDSVKQQFLNHLAARPLLVIKIWMGNVIKTFLGLFSTQLKLFIEPTVEGGDCSFSNTKGSLFERMRQYIFGNTSSKIVQYIAFTEALWNVMRYLLVALAFCFLLFTRQYFLYFFFAGSIFYFSIITGHDGCGRYRMMFEPLLIVLTSYTLCILHSNLKGVFVWQKKNLLIILLILFSHTSVNSTTYICTGVYCDQPNEDSFYPYVSGPLNKPSSSEEFQAIYWQCASVLFATSYRHNNTNDVQHLLFTNKATPPDTFAPFLQQLGVNVIQIPLTYATPNGYYHTYRGVLYRLDMIQYLADHCKDDDTIILLDSDCIWLDTHNALKQAIQEKGAIAYFLPLPSEQKLDGISRTDLKKVIYDIQKKDLHYLPQIVGAELIAAKGFCLKQIAQQFFPLWQIMLERFKEGKSKFHTDEHFLSYIYDVLGYSESAASFLQRIYTTAAPYDIPRGQELEKALWHLPNEKTSGIQTLFHLACDTSSPFWSTALGKKFKMLCATICHVVT